MKAFEFVADVDEQHHVQIALPSSVMPGQVRVIVLAPETEVDEEEALWMQGIANVWADELADAREDIYTLADGEPMDATR
jgi:hypothetical protein